MGLMGEYMFIWNALNYPCGSIPVTRVTKKDVDAKFTDNYDDMWTELLKETIKGSEGMPISVQVISHSYEDEKALAVMESIDKRI